MPSVSKKQQRWAGWQLGQLKEGQKSESGMSYKQLAEFAHSVKKKGKHA